MPSDTAGRRSSPWKRLAVAASAMLLALLATEIAHRVWRRSSGWPYDPEWMRKSLVEGRNRVTQTIPMPGDGAPEDDAGDSTEIDYVPHPYNGFDAKMVYDQIEVDLSIQDHQDAARYPILVLGGSVAGIFGSLGREAFLQEVGRDDRLKGRRVELVVLAQGGYKQPQQAIRLVWLLSLGYRPAAVIEIDGYNEVAFGNVNALEGFHPLQPSRNHWLHQFASTRTDEQMRELEVKARNAKARVAKLADFGLRFGLWRSSIAGTLLHRRMRASQHELNDSELEYLGRASEVVDVDGASGPPIHGGPEARMSVTVEGWASCSESMRAICEGRSIPYLQVLQPTLHDEGAKPMTREEIERGGAWPAEIEGVREGYPMLRARGEALRAAGMHFVDASRIFADVRETLYYDSCHFNELGMDRFARLVAKAFLDALPR